MSDTPSRTAAVLQALLVTFLWSTSWVLIKLALPKLPPLTFAALRYGLASGLLWVVVLASERRRASLRALTGLELSRLALLGVALYALTQGAQFVALSRLPAATLTLILGFTPAVVALAAWLAADEMPTSRQIPGLALGLAGAGLYFSAHVGPAPASAAAGGPDSLPWDLLPWAGLAAGLVCLAANAGSAVLGRRLLRGERDPWVVTTVSMTVGALLLATVGSVAEPAPALDGRSWLIVGWLAAVNTALAFGLWNHTLRRLTAIESSVLNNTMAIQIPVLAWVFLGEVLSAQQIAGLLFAAVGAFWVQARR